MIAVEQDKSVGQRVPRAMRKGEVAPLKSKCIEDAVMGDAADRQQRAQTRQSGDAADQELTAGGDLGRRRLVLRRHAADRVRDHAIDQLERLGRGDIVASAGKPDLEQRAVEQLAGIVAEEGPAGAVGALQPGSEPDDEEPRAVRAK